LSNPSFEGVSVLRAYYPGIRGTHAMKRSAMSAESYSTAIEYILIAAGIGLLLIGTFAQSVTRPLAFAFAAWLGLNACVFVWLALRVVGGSN
jgi:Flp pilus assembly pilin Flp